MLNNILKNIWRLYGKYMSLFNGREISCRQTTYRAIRSHWRLVTIRKREANFASIDWYRISEKKSPQVQGYP